MRITPSSLPDVWFIDNLPQTDERGFFTRVLCIHAIQQAGIAFTPQQVSVAHNTARHTLRGMHWQTSDAPEYKLVVCTLGQVYDVAVDMRPHSRYYRQHVARTLNAGQGMLLSPFFAHGYLTLSDNCQLLYAMDVPYSPECATGARWNDPALSLSWPADPAVVSDKDASWAWL